MNILKLSLYSCLLALLSIQQTYTGDFTKSLEKHAALVKMLPDESTKELISKLSILDFYNILSIVTQHVPIKRDIILSKEATLEILLEKFKQNPIEFCAGDKIQLILYLTQLLCARLQQENFALERVYKDVNSSDNDKIKLVLSKLINNTLCKKFTTKDNQDKICYMNPNLAFERILNECKIKEHVLNLIYQAMVENTLSTPTIITAEINDTTLMLHLETLETPEVPFLKRFRFEFIKNQITPRANNMSSIYFLRKIIDEAAQDIDPDYDRSLLSNIPQDQFLPE